MPGASGVGGSIEHLQPVTAKCFVKWNTLSFFVGELTFWLHWSCVCVPRGKKFGCGWCQQLLLPWPALRCAKSYACWPSPTIGDNEVVRSGAPTMMQETNLGLATGPGVVAKIGVESHGVCVPVLFVFWLPNRNHAVDGCVFP